MKYILFFYLLSASIFANAAPSAGGPWVANAWDFATEEPAVTSKKVLLTKEGFVQNGDSAVVMLAGSWKGSEFNGVYLVSAYFVKNENGNLVSSTTLLVLVNLSSDGVNPVQKRSVKIISPEEFVDVVSKLPSR